MAFANYSVSQQALATAATTHTVTLPTTAAGNLLLMHVGSLGGAASATGWTALATPANNTTTGTLLAKVATGSETTVDVTLAASSVCSVLIYQAWAWGGTLADDVDVNSRADINTDSSTLSVTAGWGAADNLMIGMVAYGDDNAAITGYPTGTTDSLRVSTNSGGNNTVVVAGVTAQVTTASYTLQQFFFDQGEDYASVVILVEPGASGSDPSGGDTTAPTFSSAPAVTATTETGHTIGATLDEAGTVYGVRLANGATAPTSAQVKAGQDSTGSAAPEAKSSAAANSASLAFSTGSASTAYDYYIVAEDDEGTPNLQASPTLVEAATAAAAVPGITQITAQSEGVALELSDWEIIVRLVSDQSVIYNQSSQSSNASGQIAAFATTGGSVGDAVRVECYSATGPHSFIIKQNLENTA